MLIQDLESLDFTSIEAFKQIWTEQRYSFINKPRSNHGLLYVVKGKITYKTDNEIIALKSGDVIFLCAGDCYTAEFDTKESPVESYLINFDITFNDKALGLLTAKLTLNDTHKNLQACFEDIAKACENAESVFLIKSLFYRCFYNISLLQHTQTATKEMLSLEYAKNLITDFDEMSIEKISQKLSMSQSTFQRKFKAAFGLTPIEFRVIKKIEKAKLWLSTTDIPIKEIAVTLKYYDEAYFNKQFKKYCGITPKQYREKNFNCL